MRFFAACARRKIRIGRGQHVPLYPMTRGPVWFAGGGRLAPDPGLRRAGRSGRRGRGRSPPAAAAGAYRETRPRFRERGRAKLLHRAFDGGVRREYTAPHRAALRAALPGLRKTPRAAACRKHGDHPDCAYHGGRKQFCIGVVPGFGRAKAQPGQRSRGRGPARISRPT